MTQPDLDSDNGRAAYRAELRAVGRVPRLIGFGLIVAGALAVLLAGQGGGETATLIGYFLLGTGWAFFAYAIILRSKHHRRRMEEMRAQLGGEST